MHSHQTKLTLPPPYFELAAHASTVSAHGQHPPHPVNRWMTVGTAARAASETRPGRGMIISNASSGGAVMALAITQRQSARQVQDPGLPPPMFNVPPRSFLFRQLQCFSGMALCVCVSLFYVIDTGSIGSRARCELGVTYLPFTVSSDAGYADLPLALLGAPVSIETLVKLGSRSLAKQDRD